MLWFFSPEISLIKAAKIGNCEKIEMLVAKGVDIQAQDRQGRTALMWACAKMHTDAVKLLLQHGADVNKKDRDGLTALMFATAGKDLSYLLTMYFWQEWLGFSHVKMTLSVVGGGSKELLKPLIENGADVNAADKTGNTALTLAVMSNQIDLTRLLVEHGADVNTRYEMEMKNQGPSGDSSYEKDWTPLMAAASFGWVELVNLLIQHGADLNANRFGETAFSKCLSIYDHWKLKQHREILKILIDSGMDLNVLDPIGNTPLIEAAQKGQSEIVKWLIQHGASLDIRNNSGCTAVMEAVLYDHEETLKVLIEHNANLNIKDDYDRIKQTPLMLACERRHVSIVKILIEGGADINMQDTFGSTALMIAATKEHGFGPMTKLLIDNGADVNIKDIYGKTVLEMSTKIKKLLKRDKAN